MTTGHEVPLAASFLLGLFGGLHCVGMCGGIASALAGTARGGSALARQLFQSAGRVASYAALGALVGGLGSPIIDRLGSGAMPWLRVIAGAIFVVAGLYLARWWMGLAHLERAGARLWRRVAPLQRRLLPLDRAWKHLLAGAIWGLLPCGLVYAALANSAAAGGASEGMQAMLAFGLGTLPALLAAGSLSTLIFRWAHSRHVAGGLLVAMGLWTVIAGVRMLPAMSPDGDEGASCHEHVAAVDATPAPGSSPPITTR